MNMENIAVVGAQWGDEGKGKFRVVITLGWCTAHIDTIPQNMVLYRGGKQLNS